MGGIMKRMAAALPLAALAACSSPEFTVDVGDTDPTGVMLKINDDPTIMSENEDYYYASTTVDDEQQASITVYYRRGAEIECDLGRIGPDDSGPFRYRIEGDRCVEVE